MNINFLSAIASLYIICPTISFANTNDTHSSDFLPPSLLNSLIELNPNSKHFNPNYYIFELDNNFLTSQFPDEIKVLKQSFIKPTKIEDLGDETTAKLILDLIEKAKKHLLVAEMSKNEKYNSERAYRIAWMMAFRFVQISKNSRSNALILNNWDANLAGNPVASVQISALGQRDPGSGNEFFTQDFWKLFETTSDTKILASYAYVIYSTAAIPKNEQRLQDKIKAVSDPKNQALLKSALEWMRYEKVSYENYQKNHNKEKADPNNPQPKCPIPRLDYNN